jgi:hypothetical protein
MFTTLRNLCINEINVRHEEKQKEILTIEGFNKVSSWYGKNYTKNPQKKLSKFLEGKKNKEIEILNQKFSEIEEAKDFNRDFVITLEWVHNRTWGYNPKVWTNTGFEYSGISGCGYDKSSTATAYALNSNPSILKLLYQQKETAIIKALEEIGSQADIKNGLNAKILGYGSGYGILPYFEGGVGVSSHEHILNSVGLVLNHVSDTKSTDVYIVHTKRD